MRAATRSVILIYLIALGAGYCGGVPSFADQGKIRQLTREAQQAYLVHNYDVAEAKYKLALAQAEKSDPKVRIILLSNLGAAYREAHKWPLADETFKRAIALAEVSGLEHDSCAVTTMRQYANLLRRMKKPAQADAFEIRATAPAVVATVAAPLRTVQPKIEIADAESSAEANDELIKKLTAGGTKKIDFDEVTPDQLKKLIASDPDNSGGWMLLGNKYRKAKQWDSAIQAYQTAAQKEKNKGKAVLGIAICCHETGQFQQAADECKRYISTNPDDAYAYLLLRSCYSNLGDQRSMVENDEEFIEKFPNHEQTNAITQMLPHLKRDIEHQSTQSTLVPEKYQPTDWEQRHCWARAPMPLKVFFIPPEDGFKFEALTDSVISESSAAEMISKSMDAWVQASQGRIMFAQAASRDEANIVVCFTDSSEGLELESAAGITSWDLSGRTNRKAKITLLTVDKETGKPCDRASFLNTCLHEFGHALGLEHSSSSKDIMYRAMHDTPMVALSPNDCLRVVKIYSLR